MEVKEAAGRWAGDQARGCITTLVFFGVALVLYVVLPEALHPYFGLIFGAIVTGIGVYASLRFGLGRYNAAPDVDAVVDALAAAVRAARERSSSARP